MDIKVTLTNCGKQSYLRNMIYSAMRGDYADVANGNDKEAIENIEKALQTELDNFANECFNRGREYEAQQQKK